MLSPRHAQLGVRKLGKPDLRYFSQRITPLFPQHARYDV